MSYNQSGSYGFIGVGKIASAIVTGLCAEPCSSRPIFLSPRNSVAAARLSKKYAPVVVCRSNQEVLDSSDMIILSVRPGLAREVCAPLRFRSDHAVVSLMAGISVTSVGGLVGPATRITQALPLPSVARRQSLTPIFPDDAAARQLFGELGGVIAVDDQNAFDALCSASASIASHLEYLAAVVDWLEGQGTRRTESRHYIGHIYSALAAAIASDEADFSELANEYSTPGGLNELMRNHLARHGVFTEVGLGLDAVHRRVAMKSF